MTVTVWSEGHRLEYEKIILVSSSLGDREQSLFLSTDEGTTFQKYPVPFLVESLLFHPKEEDKVLAYTKDSKLDFAPRPNVLTHSENSLEYLAEKDPFSGVAKEKELSQTQSGHVASGSPREGFSHPFADATFSQFFSRAVSGVDTDPNLVHMEAQDLSGGCRYLTCLIHNCSAQPHTAPFAGPIDCGSLTVQDEYIFLKATATNRTKYYVSYRRSDFVLMKLPKYALPKDLQIISTDEQQVFVAVQEWNQVDTYNLYQSDLRGVRYSLVLENVRSSRQAEENVVIDILEVRGVKGVFLANQKVDGKVTTLITYNKGRDWDYLRPPSTDMNGKPTNCQPPDCHLHLHLRWADNPYVSGTVHTKDTAPGLIMGAGNLGSQLVEYKEEMYITSDCGHTWRQVFEEEHHVLYLDHGGVIAAIKDTSIPLKILKFSVDEGHTWSTHNFTSTSVFVDGLLSEPGDETLVMTVFGHISFRSDWELVKVDFRPSFPRQCGENDYSSWDLTDLQGANAPPQLPPGQEQQNKPVVAVTILCWFLILVFLLQGDHCIMGQQRSYRKRKSTSCDYGFERSSSSESTANKCSANFWFNPLSPPEDCVLGQTYTSSLGYRKVVSNVCEGGVDLQQSPVQLQCPLTAPRGLQVSIRGEAVAVRPREDVLFVVRQEQGDVLTTKYQVDLGDGFKAMYVNLTLTGEPIRHHYESPGIYRVSVRAENMAGHDEAVLFVQVNCKSTAPLRR
ncbi:sortilin-related VPS10 domain containing receptor 2 [Cricetulus griseus]